MERKGAAVMERLISYENIVSVLESWANKLPLGDMVFLANEIDRVIEEKDKEVELYKKELDSYRFTEQQLFQKDKDLQFLKEDWKTIYRERQDLDSKYSNQLLEYARLTKDYYELSEKCKELQETIDNLFDDVNFYKQENAKLKRISDLNRLGSKNPRNDFKHKFAHSEDESEVSPEDYYKKFF